MTEFQSYKELLVYIENTYNEEDQITIENFISYYININNGFTRLNCESTYQDGLKHDIDGKLHALAIIGFNFGKKIYDERKSSRKNRK